MLLRPGIDPIEFAHYNALVSIAELAEHVRELHGAKDRAGADRALERARDEARDLLAELEGLRDQVCAGERVRI